jgi:hypothetical protein
MTSSFGRVRLLSSRCSLFSPSAFASRYERNQPVVLTSNKAFSEWGAVFAGDPVMASAALDRLLHRCTVINIRGESYRLKEKRQAAKATLAVTPADLSAADLNGSANMGVSSL